MNKICTSCKVEKPHTFEFFPRSKRRDGTPVLKSQCKLCIKAYDTKRRDLSRGNLMQRTITQYRCGEVITSQRLYDTVAARMGNASALLVMNNERVKLELPVLSAASMRDWRA